ncbi:MAG TPA: dienelactone hydrolase family protein [Candidatus Binataceae bacterium]|nr:dienelactone hydrolase family protein [Candidatus Binataceae bacterium]
MKTETIEYKDGDVTCRGYLAYDETKTGKRPGILVMPEALGLGTHAKSRAERLAQLGYVALAGDPYGGGKEYATVQEAIKSATELMSDPVKTRSRARAALDKLASLPQVDSSKLAEIGFCMGGTFGLELARDGAPLKGVVTFHSGLQTQKPAEPGKIKAKILINTGADDPMVQSDVVKAFQEEMTKAGANWQLISYSGTKHSFTNPDAASAGMPQALEYNKQTDERSWKAMVNFFEEIFA